MAHNSSDDSRCHTISDVEAGQPVTSAVMFSVSVASNLVALVLLEVRRRRTSPSVYQVLVTALLMTDLLGSMSVSPVVLAAYIRRKTLVSMSMSVCSYFGFNMTFLSLSTLAILCVMALERYLSIGHPYFYERHLSKRRSCVAIALVYGGNVLFCVLPFLGFGKYVQYCPGTWCFLEMSHMEGRDKVYIGFYAFFILATISSTVLCNVSVISHLVVMHRRHKARRSRVSAPPRYGRSLSMTEEVEHLLPLAIITVVFIFCTFPLVLRVVMTFTESHKERHVADLRALRLLSIHSIINPWVFIILRPSALKIIWRKLQKPQKSTFLSEMTLSAQSKQAGGVGLAVQLPKQESEDDIGTRTVV
ncbi:prostaglandin E receptor 2b subtype EP2 [Pempheris klunzingeri]|uniref:prostaglandin E receptor 2b subtype EP2 n=1 Tax=Pempheris klunzingeri TaxID=3127111 RepID=UPI0039814B6B